MDLQFPCFMRYIGDDCSPFVVKFVGESLGTVVVGNEMWLAGSASDGWKMEQFEVCEAPSAVEMNPVDYNRKFWVFNMTTGFVVRTDDDYEEACFYASRSHEKTDQVHVVLQKRGVTKLTKSATVGE